MAEHARTFATGLGRDNLAVSVDAAELRLDPDRWSALWTTLVHLVSNAVDHGVEPLAERAAAGKPERAAPSPRSPPPPARSSTRPPPRRPRPPPDSRFPVLDRGCVGAGDLVPYMGMAGYAAFVRVDLNVFAHVRSSGSVPMAALHFRRADVIEAAAFDARVRPEGAGR